MASVSSFWETIKAAVTRENNIYLTAEMLSKNGKRRLLWVNLYDNEQTVNNNAYMGQFA